MEPQPVVAITLREIYDAVVRLTGRVDVLIQQQSETTHDVQDHENRLRSLERSRWPLHSITALVSVAAVVVAVLAYL
jgi:hypothetical protein